MNRTVAGSDDGLPEGTVFEAPPLPNRTVAGPEHGIAAEWPDVYECYCGALVNKDRRQDIDHFTIHRVTRP